MGTGSSSSLQYGVPVNPRVNYANSRSKKESKIVRIDAPALVHLRHGTVRYRFEDAEVKKDRREKPHEGDADLHKKRDYFYHHKHNFRSGAEPTAQDSWKYCHVYKGPERAKQKRLYYVFGKGLKVNEDNGFVQSGYKPEQQSFQRPIFYKTPGHVYLDLIFLKGDKPVSDEDEDAEPSDPLERPLDEDPVDAEALGDIEVKMKVCTKVVEIKLRLAKKLVKPLPHIHLYARGAELRPDQELSDLTTLAENQLEVNVLLHPK